MPDVFSEIKRRGYHIANIKWIMEKVRQFQKDIYSCFILYRKYFSVDHNKLWIALKNMAVPGYLRYADNYSDSWKQGSLKKSLMEGERKMQKLV